MKRFERKLPRMTAPPQASRINDTFKPHFCSVRLTCQACGRDIKHDEKRGIVGRLLVHLKEECIEEAGALQLQA